MATLKDREGYLKDMEEYLTSDQFMVEFQYSEEERRLELLGFLEKLMELGDLADETATKIIFPQLGPQLEKES